MRLHASSGQQNGTACLYRLPARSTTCITLTIFWPGGGAATALPLVKPVAVALIKVMAPAPGMVMVIVLEEGLRSPPARTPTIDTV